MSKDDLLVLVQALASADALLAPEEKRALWQRIKGAVGGLYLEREAALRRAYDAQDWLRQRDDLIDKLKKQLAEKAQ